MNQGYRFRRSGTATSTSRCGVSMTRTPSPIRTPGSRRAGIAGRGRPRRRKRRRRRGGNGEEAKECASRAGISEAQCQMQRAAVIGRSSSRDTHAFLCVVYTFLSILHVFVLVLHASSCVLHAFLCVLHAFLRVFYTFLRILHAFLRVLYVFLRALHIFLRI